jgi:hypothetical protein
MPAKQMEVITPALQFVEMWRHSSRVRLYGLYAWVEEQAFLVLRDGHGFSET